MATTVFHPTIPDVSYEIDDDAVDAWVSQGWLKSEPKNAAVKAAKKAADKADPVPVESPVE